jgi:hypothetical protein
MTTEQEKLLIDLNRKLDRLLTILDGPEEGCNESLFLHCIRESVNGNGEPLEAYMKRGGKIPKRKRGD